MVTASTPSASSGSTPLNAGQPSARETKSRCLPSGSATPTSLTPGRSANTRAWLLPMTPTPTTPTRNGGGAARVATCTMMDESPPAGSRDESLLARPEAPGYASVRGCGHVLNQRVTSPTPSGTFLPSVLAKSQKPIDEAADALIDRRVGPEADGALKVGSIRTGLRDISRLHRKQLPHRRLAQSLFDQAHDLGYLDRR